MAVNDAVLQLLFRHDANVVQDRAGQAFDHVQPRTVFERESEFEASCRLLGELGIGFLADMRGMIVEDDLDHVVGHTSCVEQPEKSDECAAAVPIPGPGIEVAGQRSMRAAD